MQLLEAALLPAAAWGLPSLPERVRAKLGGSLAAASALASRRAHLARARERPRCPFREPTHRSAIGARPARNRLLLKQTQLAMDAATKRQVAKLGAAGGAAKVLASLCSRMVDAASGDPIAEAIAARLEEVPAAREQLVQQLEAGNDDALWLLFAAAEAEPQGSSQSAEPSSPAVQPWKRVLRTLATSEELGPRAVSALVAALHAGSGRTRQGAGLLCAGSDGPGEQGARQGGGRRRCV